MLTLTLDQQKQKKKVLNALAELAQTKNAADPHVLRAALTELLAGLTDDK